MTNTIKQTGTRPMAPEMSMDDILLSIRKIIASEETPMIPLASAPPALLEESLNPVIKQPLSAREQLRNLANYDYGVGLQEFSSSNTAHPSHESQHKTMPMMQTPIQKPMSHMEHQILTPMMPAPVMTSSIETPSLKSATSEAMTAKTDTASILKTLEDIRRSLSPELSSELLSASLQQMPSQDCSIDFLKQEIESVLHDTMEHVVKSPSVVPAHQEMDIRTKAFSADQVPEFLKKFKQEQNSTPIDKEGMSGPDYDFSKLAHFDDDEGIMELTKPVLESQEMPQGIMLSNKKEVDYDLMLSQGAKSIRHQQESEEGVSEALEMLMLKSLRPMLREWIDTHLEDVTKQVIREELLKKTIKK